MRIRELILPLDCGLEQLIVSDLTHLSSNCIQLWVGDGVGARKEQDTNKIKENGTCVQFNGHNHALDTEHRVVMSARVSVLPCHTLARGLIMPPNGWHNPL